MQRLKLSYLSNNVFLVVFSVLLTLLTLTNYYFIIPLIIYLIWLKRSEFFEMSIYLSIIIGSLFLYKNIELPNLDRQCLVIEANTDYSICKNKTKYIVYEEYNVGDYIYINGDFHIPSTQSSPFTFNYRTYLKSKGIYYVVYKPDAEVISKRNTIYDIREIVRKYLDTFEIKNKSYLSALIIGDKSLIEDSIIDSMVDIGIIHLFAISGLHVGLLCLSIKKILNYLSFEEDNFLIVFLIFYMIIAGFSVSVVRASLMFILSILNKKLNLPFSSLDIISITFLIFLLINPLSILDVGFQLSFIVTLFLLLGNLLIKGDLLTQSLYVSLLAQLATLPIIINLNNQINILSVIFNIFFVLLMTYLLLPVTFVTFIVKPLNDFYLELILFFEKIVMFINDYNIIINIANLHVIVVILYYTLLLIFLINLENNKIYKYFYLVFILFFVPMNPFDSVYFIDVEQGDSTLFKSKFNSCNVLIDTGGKLDRDITNRNVVPLLNSIGTNNIDYFVLTHSHFDHVGGAKDILNNYKVKYLVISKYNTGHLIKDVEEYANKRGVRVLKVTKGDYIGCNNEFRVIEPIRSYQSINNQSLVFDINYADKRWILMGDSELKKFDVKDIDILKAGHHGSNTSINEKLLHKFNPETVIISSGRNSYGLPSKDTLELFNENNIHIYRTDEQKTITYINIGNGIFLDTVSYNSIVLGKPKLL